MSQHDPSYIQKRAKAPSAQGKSDLQRAAVNSAPLSPQRISLKPEIAVPSIVYDVLSSPGQPIDAGTRAFMEPRFGHDFSQVRVHTDAQAAESAQAVDALAYTVGRNIVFGAGQYSPETPAGQQVLAHELTHVAQQSGVSAGSTPTKGLEIGQLSDPAEQEANNISKGLMSSIEGKQVIPTRISTLRALRLQRYKQPLSGWGNTLFSDKSYIEFTPRASLWINGAEKEHRTFEKGSFESITIPLNSDGILQFVADIHAEKDNGLLTSNDKKDWQVRYDWHVTVNDRGKLAIDIPAGGTTPQKETENFPWALSVTPESKDRDLGGSIGVNFNLVSTVSKTSGSTTTGTVGGQVAPEGVGGSASGQYSRTSQTTTGLTNSFPHTFVLNITIPSPGPRVELEIGPITIINTYPFYFGTGSAELGTNPETSQDEDTRLTTLFHSLDTESNGGAGISGTVFGYASPVGKYKLNQQLSDQRAQTILKKIRLILPRSSFVQVPLGSAIWLSEGVSKVDNSEAHRVVIVNVRRTSNQ
jgi:outer membrane protein OmpA-like peptidoglycan-associated protein